LYQVVLKKIDKAVSDPENESLPSIRHELRASDGKGFVFGIAHGLVDLLEHHLIQVGFDQVEPCENNAKARST